MMVEIHKRKLNSRGKLRLSRTKLLCAAGLTFCDFTTTHAANAEGYLPDAKLSPPYHNVHGTPGIFLPTASIKQNKTINDLHLDDATNSASLGSDLDDYTSLQDPKLKATLQHDTSRFPTTATATYDPIRGSEGLPRPRLGTDLSSNTPNRPIAGLPRPPPSQWIRDNRTEQQPVNRIDRHLTSESIMPPNFNVHPNTRRNKRDGNIHVQPRNDLVSSPNYSTNSRTQRRVPLHLQQATTQHQQNYFPSQSQMNEASSRSNQAPRAFRSVSPLLSNDGNSQENVQNNRHARSYQSRIMQQHPEQQRYIPEPSSSEHSRTRFEQPLKRDQWSRTVAVAEDQRYGQVTASGNRSGFRSLRVDPTVNQYTQGSTMNYRTKKVSENNFHTEIGQAMDDPNNSIVSLVPGRSNSQLARVEPSFHGAILDDRINQVGTKWTAHSFF